ncbi:DUF3817 domain-containing protein [Nocardiopsis baichengensis]|uniref:DUF3817 domain-containing protein n=1 Tax=Nocardiopsis baichengensis TaxID=280240 RepID=UPI00034520DE|nr:DUF3817 domain-containing protein [Nocardiopsis baichengensis]
MPTAPTAPAPSRTGGPLPAAFRWIAAIEALTWVGLLIGMFFKYVVVGDDIGVRVFGPIHGVAFIIYVVVAAAAWYRLRWGLWTGLFGLAASIPPLGTVVFERIASARGLLDPAEKRATRSGPGSD